MVESDCKLAEEKSIIDNNLLKPVGKLYYNLGLFFKNHLYVSFKPFFNVMEGFQP